MKLHDNVNCEYLVHVVQVYNLRQGADVMCFTAFKGLPQSFGVGFEFVLIPRPQCLRVVSLVLIDYFLASSGLTHLHEVTCLVNDSRMAFIQIRIGQHPGNSRMFFQVA